MLVNNKEADKLSTLIPILKSEDLYVDNNRQHVLLLVVCQPYIKHNNSVYRIVGIPIMRECDITTWND